MNEQAPRETVVDRPATADPCVLVVEFRLRAVRGWGHTAFRPLSLQNTPLFVGFPVLPGSRRDAPLREPTLAELTGPVAGSD